MVDKTEDDTGGVKPVVTKSVSRTTTSAQQKVPEPIQSTAAKEETPSAPASVSSTSDADAVAPVSMVDQTQASANSPQQLDNTVAPNETTAAQASKLEHSVEAAEALLAYAAESGRNIDESQITVIVETARLVKAKQALSPDLEVQFWVAFRKLSETLSPVTHQSLLATEVSHASADLAKLNAGKTATRYQALTIVALIILLLVQSYTLILSTVISDAKSGRQELERREATLYEAQRDLAFARDVLCRSGDDKFCRTEPQITAADPGEATLSESSGISVIIPNSDFLVFGPLPAPPEQQELTSDPSAEKPDSDTAASIQFLEARERLNEINRNLTKFNVDFNYRMMNNHHILHNYNSHWRWIGLLQPVSFTFLPRNFEEASRSTEWVSENIAAVLNNAEIILQLLSLYILPIIYGFIGACAYVLRTISTQIKERQLPSSSNIQMNLRLILGALAGLSIAWFISPDAWFLNGNAGAGDATGGSAFVLKITPLALAFLAGYSVELLFSAMDIFIGAFSRNRKGEV